MREEGEDKSARKTSKAALRGLSTITSLNNRISKKSDSREQ